jgi:hypothetical protein
MQKTASKALCISFHIPACTLLPMLHLRAIILAFLSLGCIPHGVQYWFVLARAASLRPASSLLRASTTTPRQALRFGEQDTSSLLPMLPIPAWQAIHFDQQLWSEKYHYYACLIPKCGSTSWISMIKKAHLTEKQLQVENRVSIHLHTSYAKEGLFFRPFSPAKRDVEYDYKYPPDKARIEARAVEVLNDPAFFKFAIVRHPWNRLVSGFLDKYVGVCQKNRDCFRRYVPEVSGNIAEPLTLTELLLALQRAPELLINRHFLQATHQCDLGRVPYDFIADSENPAHLAHLMRKIKSPISLLRENDHRWLDNGSIAGKQISCTRYTVDLAARFYAEDLKVLGLTMDEAYESCEKYGLAHPPK